MAGLRTTLIALAAPRRSIPIALVTASLVAVQVYYSRSLIAGVVPAALALGFVVVAPAAWRVLLGTATSPLRLAAYASVGVATVGALGVALPFALGLGPTFLTDIGSLAIATVLFLVGGWGLGRDIQLEQRLAHSQLLAVQANLDPHFLFNTLNAIAEWCREDAKVAEEATLRLAAMLREMLDGFQLERWSFERELALVEDMLELHRIRDVDAFTIAIDVAAELRTIAVPPLMVLSLAENAVKHGPRKGHRGAIELRARAIGDRLHVELENPGTPEPGATGRGLAMLDARLAIYDPRARFALAEVGGRTRATLDLPRERAP